MSIILHITSLEQWKKAKAIGLCDGDILVSQGFIHCSTPRQVIKVANVLNFDQKGLVLLCIEPEKVNAQVRYEGYEGEEIYPHIYGRLNIDAVVKVVGFEPGNDGTFKLPRE